MAETIYTPDGKTHVLLGSTTLESIVRQYAGDDAADQVAILISCAKRLSEYEPEI